MASGTRHRASRSDLFRGLKESPAAGVLHPKPQGEALLRGYFGHSVKGKPCCRTNSFKMPKEKPCCGAISSKIPKRSPSCRAISFKISERSLAAGLFCSKCQRKALLKDHFIQNLKALSRVRAPPAALQHPLGLIYVGGAQSALSARPGASFVPGSLASAAQAGAAAPRGAGSCAWQGEERVPVLTSPSGPMAGVCPSAFSAFWKRKGREL